MHHFPLSLCLCVKDESGLKMNSVDHIPQTLASHSRLPVETQTSRQHGADMLKPDPRDTFFRSEPLSDAFYRFSCPHCVIPALNVIYKWGLTLISSLFLPFSAAPMIDPSRLDNVLPPCLYSPTYVVKDFPIARYQGLQFVSTSHTHLHMHWWKLVCWDVRVCVCMRCCESNAGDSQVLFCVSRLMSWDTKEHFACMHLLQRSLSDCWNHKADIKQCCPHVANIQQCRQVGV